MIDRILMITSEAVPFAKSGGLADMVSALSTALAYQGRDVRILMPLYGFLDDKELEVVSLNYPVPFSNRAERASLFAGKLPESDVPVYFLKCDKYFNRTGIYGPTPASAYPDNGLRYSFLSRAALFLPKELDWEPQVYHSHDWPTGLSPLYLKMLRTEGKKQGASVFTIHNMGYQGEFSIRDIPWAGLSREDLDEFNLLAEGKLNYLKTGIDHCDIITTVSPTYAKEIQTKEYGHGLEKSLSKRKKKLEGIVNGVDYSEWNPRVDKYIEPYNYSPETPGNKKELKKKLQEEFGLPLSDRVPVFAMISRLVEQKGIQELCHPETGILSHFCINNDVQVIILGTGEEWCEKELETLAREIPNLSVRITYNNKLSHLIEAGADFFMMPSRYEPCGLNQLYSLKYGTLPIVRRTGGLADTVTESSRANPVGTGFLFDEVSPKALLKILEEACTVWYKDPELIEKMKRKAMEEDFSWGPSASEYIKVYERALKEN